MSGGDEQEFVIKNGSGNRGDVRIRAPISGTLLDLKKVLQAEYPGNPQPSGQTLIHAGRVLKEENVPLETLLKHPRGQANQAGGADSTNPAPISLHLVVKQPAVPAPATTQAAAASAATASALAAAAVSAAPGDDGASGPPPTSSASSTADRVAYPAASRRPSPGSAPPSSAAPAANPFAGNDPTSSSSSSGGGSGGGGGGGGGRSASSQAASAREEQLRSNWFRQQHLQYAAQQRRQQEGGRGSTGPQYWPAQPQPGMFAPPPWGLPQGMPPPLAASAAFSAPFAPPGYGAPYGHPYAPPFSGGMPASSPSPHQQPQQQIGGVSGAAYLQAGAHTAAYGQPHNPALAAAYSAAMASLNDPLPAVSSAPATAPDASGSGGGGGGGSPTPPRSTSAGGSTGVAGGGGGESASGGGGGDDGGSGGDAPTGQAPAAAAADEEAGMAAGGFGGGAGLAPVGAPGLGSFPIVALVPVGMLNALGLQQQAQQQQQQQQASASPSGDHANNTAPAASGGTATASTTQSFQQPTQPAFQLQLPPLPPPPFNFAIPGAGAFPFNDMGALAGAPPFMPGFPPPLGFLPGAYPPPTGFPPPNFGPEGVPPPGHRFPPDGGVLPNGQPLVPYPGATAAAAGTGAPPHLRGYTSGHGTYAALRRRAGRNGPPPQANHQEGRRAARLQQALREVGRDGAGGLPDAAQDPLLPLDAAAAERVRRELEALNALPPRQPGVRPAAVVRINLNMRVILQVAVLLLLLWQHCPPGRFFALVLGAAVLYISAFSPLRRWLQRITGMVPAQGAAAPGGAGIAAGAGNGNGGAGAAPAAAAAQGGGVAGAPAAAAVPRRGGVLREIRALLIGFFTSLLPGWNINPEDAAAFAAAQQMAAAEAAREAAREAAGPE